MHRLVQAVSVWAFFMSARPLRFITLLFVRFGKRRVHESGCEQSKENSVGWDVQIKVDETVHAHDQHADTRTDLHETESWPGASLPYLRPLANIAKQEDGQ